jgi:Tol biopolymer transport system component
MARYAPPGYLLYLDGEVTATHHRLLARRFDAGRGRASGEEQLVLDRVEASNFGCANLTAAAGGGLVTQRWQAAHLRLEWRDWQGNTMGVAVQDLDGAPGPLSPDGTRLAYSGNDPRDLYVLDMASGVSTRLTFENHDVSWMCWSPDGRRIAFARVTGSRGWECRLKSADGSGPDSMLFHGPGLFSYPLQWSRDGRWLLMRCTSASGNFDLWRMPMTGAGKPEVYQQTAAEEGDGCLSPDGRWVAYVADENGKPGLYVQSFPEPGARYQVAISDPAAARWSRRGDALGVITRNGDPVLIQVSTAGGFRQGAATRRPTLPRQPRLEDISPDEQRLLMGSRKDLTGATSLEVVLGWTQLLEKR